MRTRIAALAGLAFLPVTQCSTIARVVNTTEKCAMQAAGKHHPRHLENST